MQERRGGVSAALRLASLLRSDHQPFHAHGRCARLWRIAKRCDPCRQSGLHARIDGRRLNIESAAFGIDIEPNDDAAAGDTVVGNLQRLGGKQSGCWRNFARGRGVASGQQCERDCATCRKYLSHGLRPFR